MSSREGLSLARPLLLLPAAAIPPLLLPRLPRGSAFTVASSGAIILQCVHDLLLRIRDRMPLTHVINFACSLFVSCSCGAVQGKGCGPRSVRDLHYMGLSGLAVASVIAVSSLGSLIGNVARAACWLADRTPLPPAPVPEVVVGDCECHCRCEHVTAAPPWEPPGGALLRAAGQFALLLVIALCAGLRLFCRCARLAEAAPRQLAAAPRVTARRLRVPKELDALAVDASTL